MGDAPVPRRRKYPAGNEKKRRRLERHPIPMTGLPLVYAHEYHFPAAPPVRALFAEVEGFRVVMGLDEQGRVVGLSIHTGNTMTGAEQRKRTDDPRLVGQWGFGAGPHGRTSSKARS